MRTVIISLALCLAACSSSKPEVRSEKSATRIEPDQGSSTARETCVAALERARQCTAQYIPALVDARVRHDTPPGIAAKDAEIGRDALVAMALDEWKESSSDEGIAAACANLQAEAEALNEQAQECLEASSCDAFVGCFISLREARWDSR